MIKKIMKINEILEEYNHFQDERNGINLKNSLKNMINEEKKYDIYSCNYIQVFDVLKADKIENESEKTVIYFTLDKCQFFEFISDLNLELFENEPIKVKYINLISGNEIIVDYTPETFIYKSNMTRDIKTQLIFHCDLEKKPDYFILKYRQYCYSGRLRFLSFPRESEGIYFHSYGVYKKEDFLSSDKFIKDEEGFFLKEHYNEILIGRKEYEKLKENDKDCPCGHKANKIESENKESIQKTEDICIFCSHKSSSKYRLNDHIKVCQAKKMLDNNKELSILFEYKNYYPEIFEKLTKSALDKKDFKLLADLDSKGIYNPEWLKS